MPPAGPPWYSGPGMFDPADPLISASYAGWWQRGMTVLKAGWRPLLVLQLIAVVAGIMLEAPARVYQALQVAGTAPALSQPGQLRFDALGELFAGIGVVTAAALVVAMVGLVATLAGIRTVVLVATGGQPGVGTQLRASLRRVPPMLGWSVLGLLATVLAACACLLPAFYVGGVLLVLPAVVLFERGNAIERCFRLFHADLGAALARVATMAALLVGSAIAIVVTESIISAAVEPPLVPGASVAVAPTIVATLLGFVVELVLSTLVSVVVTVLIVTTYADLRARHEPLTTGTLVGELNAP